jgi:hypothetical protein
MPSEPKKGTRAQKAGDVKDGRTNAEIEMERQRKPTSTDTKKGAAHRTGRATPSIHQPLKETGAIYMNALKAAMASAGREDEQERIADQLEGMLDELEAVDVMRKRTAQEIRDELAAQGVRDPDLVDFDADDLNDDITDGLPFATEDDPHQQAKAEAADERALAAVFGQAVATQPDDSSTLVQNTRDTFQRNLDVCVA